MTKRNIVHVEIPAANINNAADFYKNLFGWEIQPFPDLNYVMWDAGHGSSGGFIPVSEEFQVGDILIYINSEDIDADLMAVEKLGGKIIRPKTEIPQMGWYGIFKDPTGNLMALYTGMNPS